LSNLKGWSLPFQKTDSKNDPLQITAIKKLANMKSIPYQTLIRHWLAQDIKKELETEGRR